MALSLSQFLSGWQRGVGFYDPCLVVVSLTETFRVIGFYDPFSLSFPFLGGRQRGRVFCDLALWVSLTGTVWGHRFL